MNAEQLIVALLNGGHVPFRYYEEARRIATQEDVRLLAEHLAVAQARMNEALRGHTL